MRPPGKIVTPPCIRQNKKDHNTRPRQKFSKNKKGIHFIVNSWYNIYTQTEKEWMEVSSDMDVKIENDVIRAAMKARGLTQMALAKEIGMSQNNLSNIVNRTRMSVMSVKELLDAMGYDLVVVDRKTGKQCWRIDV